MSNNLSTPVPLPRPNHLRDSLSSVRDPTQSRNGISLPASPKPAPQSLEILVPPHPSTVVRLTNIRSTPLNLLWNLFSHACAQLNLSDPAPFFPPANPPDVPNASLSAICAVFSSQRDARAALALSCDIYAVSPANDADLFSPRRLNPDVPDRDRDPHIRRVHTLPPLLSVPPDMTPQIYSTGPRPALPLLRPTGSPFSNEPVVIGTTPFTISSNPPNPKTSFRAGDWMCSTPSCSAHNFQRNTTCIACGRPRAGNAPLPLPDSLHSPTYPLANPSPRFAGRFASTHSAPHTPNSGAPLPPPPPASGSNVPYNNNATSTALAAAQAQLPLKAPPPQYPSLTPSGRTLSVGGRVRNISRDPLAPCVMYWPDNEPLPEPCQIRPIDSALMTYPPIINTGNKGAAEKQPGDWLCGKCNYHNWRRRKVCQTCFPYAEGNGDSISAAVQAERVALLTNVLATQLNSLDLNDVPDHPNAHRQAPPPSSAPPQSMRFLDGPGSSAGNSLSPSPLLPPLPLSEQDKMASPIYQTSGAHGNERPTRNLLSYHHLLAPSANEHNLLPSFLQDIVHSPAQSPSPTSSSSADLSFDGSEDAHYVMTSSASTSVHSGLPPTPNHHGLSGPVSRKGSASSFNSLGRSGGSSIWKLDGDESRTLSSTSSSARTSPTAAFAQVAHGIPTPAFTLPSPIAAVGATPTESGTTPKFSTGFWQARYH